MSALPEHILSRLRLPVIAAPMLRVSGIDLVIEACRGGVIGSFPTANARTAGGLHEWLVAIESAAAASAVPFAPHCPNLIIRQPQLMAHLEVLLKHRVEMVITSVGSPEAVIKPLHEVGAIVFSDVASIRHAHKALEAGADGLVLLTAGAGGQTGWLNGFAFVRAVRKFFEGPLVLAGGISDGRSLAAARMLGCDLGYVGTSFIATTESLASDEYKQMIVASGADDVLLTKAFSGLATSMLRPAIVKAGLDPDHLDEQISAPDAEALYGTKAKTPLPKRWVDLFSAGHSVSGVDRIRTVAELIEETKTSFEKATAS